MRHSSAQVNQGLGQSRDGQNNIHGARSDGGVGHGTKLRSGEILGHGGSASGLDGLNASRAVPPRTAQNNANGSLAIVYRNRFEKEINRGPGVMHGRGAQQAYGARL